MSITSFRSPKAGKRRVRTVRRYVSDAISRKATVTALSLISEAPAVFSPDRKYRCVLRRRVGFGDRSVLVVMLNPSIADEERDDATVKRVIGFAVAYGFSWLTVCNAFGFCSTEPENLYRVDDPVGPDNDSTIV